MNESQFVIGDRVEIAVDITSEYDLKQGSVGTIIGIDQHEMSLVGKENDVWPIKVRLDNEFLSDSTYIREGYFRPEELVFINDDADNPMVGINFGTILANL